MKKIKPQEVWQAYFPYKDNSGRAKFRPVIVLDVDDNEAVVLSVMVTSHKPRNDEYDIEIYDWEDVPLEHVSTARVAKNELIPKDDFNKKIGRLSDDDWDNITNLYARWLQYNSY